MRTLSSRRGEPSDLIRHGSWRDRLIGVLIALAAVGGATAIGLAASLRDQPGSGLLYLIAVCVATYLGGLYVGLLAAALSYIPYGYYFLPTNDVDAGTGIFALAAFGVAAVSVIFLVGREQRARHTAETTLGEEQRIAEILELTETGSWGWDVEAGEVRWSQNLGPVYGLSEPATYEQFLELIHPDDRPSVADAIERARRGENYDLELRAVPPDGTIRWIAVQARTIGGPGTGKPLHIVGLSRDITDQKRREERETFLASATEILSASLDYEQTLGAVTKLALETLADWCSVDLLDADGRLVNVALAHADEDELRLARELRRRFPPDPAAPAGALHAIRTGQSQLYPEIPQELLDEAAPDPELRTFVHGLGLRSAMVVPLAVAGEVLGAITFVTAETPRRYDHVDLALAEELAARAAAAVQQARLHRAEQEARAEAEALARRIGRLQRLTAQLSAAATSSEVAEVLVREGSASFGAIAGWVSIRAEGGDALEHLSSFGYEDAFVEQYRRIPLDASLAVAEVARTGRAMWLESTRHERHPELVTALAATGGESLAILPIGTGVAPVGFMALRFTGPRTFPEEERQLLLQLARQYSETVERAHLYEAERRSRELVSRLQLVTAALSAALTRSEVADAVIDVAIPALDAKTGVVCQVEGEELVVLRSTGYEGAPFPERLSLDDRWPLADAVRRKTTVELETLADRRKAYAVPEEVWAVSGQGMLIAAPLIAGDRAVGAIGFTRDEPGKLKPRDAVFVRLLTGQAALALERAGLYEAELEARGQVDRLQSVTSSFSAAADVSQVVRVILDEALPALGARAGGVRLLGDTGALELVDSRGYEAVADELPQAVALDSSHPAAVAVRTGEIVVFESGQDGLDEEAGVSESVRTATGDGTLAVVPMLVGSRPIGTFGFSLDEPRPLTEEELAFVLSLGRQAAQAVERARLFEREQEARRDVEEASIILRALQGVGEIGLTARSVEELLGSLLAFLRDSVLADWASVMLRNEDGDLVTRAAVGFEEELGTVVPWGQGISGRIAARRESLVVDDVVEAGAASPHLRAAGGSLVGVPLLVGEEAIGVISIGTFRKRAFALRHVSLLEAAAVRVALAVERTTLLEREQEARRDAEEAGETLRALQAIGEIGLRARTLDELLEALLVFLRDAVGADWASVLLAEEQGLAVRAAVGPHGEIAGQSGARWSGGIGQRIAASGRPLVVDDLSEAGTAGTEVAPTGGSLIGVPLLTGNETLGVLSVGSETTRAFRPRHVSLIEAAAARVALAVERTVLFEREHEVAVTLQRSVLPQAVPQRPGVELAVRYVPGASGLEVGGDWYDAIELESGELGLVVGDVVGKGVTAAATMAQLRNALRVYALEGLKPSSVVARLNRLVETTGPSFATLLYAVLDADGTLRYASAGHPPPVLIRRSGRAELLEGGRSVPLGVHGDPPFRQDSLQLQPGETVLLYTDGLVERRNVPLEARLQQLLALASSEAGDVEELVDHVLAALSGDNPSDDVAMLAVRLTPISKERLDIRMPARPQSLADIRHRLRAWLATVGASDTESHEIVLACSETSANAIRHPRLPSRPLVDVAVELTDGEVQIAVRDYGTWVEPSRDHTGMGLRLVRESMDSVEIERREDGTRVVLRKRLLRAPAPAAAD